MQFPGHAVSVWLGHSEAVSREHYLQIPGDPWDRPAGLAVPGAAQCAAVGSRTESQGVAKDDGDNSASHAENPISAVVFAPYDTGTAIGPGGNRTHDQAIMSRLL